MADFYKTNFKAQTPGDEPLQNIFDLLTPEEKAQYAKNFQPTTKERVFTGLGGVADVISSAGGGRNDHYYGEDMQKRSDNRIGQDMQFVGNELTRKYAERQAKAAAEKANKEASAFKGILDDDFSQLGNPDLTSEDAWNYWKTQSGYKNQQKLQQMKPRPAGSIPKNPFIENLNKTMGTAFGKELMQRPETANLDSVVDAALDVTLKGPETGKFKTAFGTKAWVDKDLEQQQNLYKTIDIKNLSKMFSGMSRVIDSNAERSVFKLTQPDISNFKETNAMALLGIKSLNKKYLVDQNAKQAWIAENGNLINYVSPVENLTSVVTPNGQVELVPKQDVARYKNSGYLTIDEYAKTLSSKNSSGRVRVISPDGVIGFVSKKELEQALTEGYQKVQ
ncbi:MAG TPA: hypothetical protein PLP33_31030 [Leptospiraceae bacterium]|nr:hypothetical protein [Leptospiraceae bacterium]